MKKEKRDLKKTLKDTNIEIDEDGKLRCKECEEELTIPLEYRQHGVIYYSIDEDGDFCREDIYSDEAGYVYCPNCLTDLYEYDEEKTKIILQYLKSMKEARREESEQEVYEEDVNKEVNDEKRLE